MRSILHPKHTLLSAYRQCTAFPSFGAENISVDLPSSFVCSRVDVDVLALLDSFRRSRSRAARERREWVDVADFRSVPHEQELEQPAAQHSSAQRQHARDDPQRQRAASLLPALQRTRLPQHVANVERYCPQSRVFSLLSVFVILFYHVEILFCIT